MHDKSKKRRRLLSIERAGWYTQLFVSFALMAVIPILTFVYFVTSYIVSSVVTRESVVLVITFNVIIAAGGFMVLRKTIRALTEFRNYLRHVAEGDLQTSFDVANGPDVTNLTNSLRSIVDRLQADRELLEKDVHKRAKELEYLNQRLKSELAERRSAEVALRNSNMELSDALQDLKTMQGELIQQERIGALTQMAGGIAHDFNNALMPIVGLSEFLIADPDILEDKKELLLTLTDIHDASEDARNVVRRLRNFYKSDTELDLASVDLNEVIQKSINLTRPRWRQDMQSRGVHIDFKEELETLPPILGHAGQLREVFVSLILNASAAIPDKGTITVRAYSDPTSAFVEIQDTGEGMTSEVKKHCLEPFFSTKGVQGTGMGLTMASGIVSRHKGTLTIDSEPGKGATIKISLPLETEVDTAEIRPMPVISGSARSLNVLIVEDDPRSSRLLERYLKADTHKTIVQDSGEKGIARFKTDQFDLVITDRAMPDMNGDAVAAAIKELNGNTPIIMLTGFGEIMRDTGESPKSVDKVLSKPTTPTELRMAIYEVMERYTEPSVGK